MKKKAFTLVEIMIIVTIIGLLAAMIIPACGYVRGSEGRESAEYSAWCKLNRRTDISFEEWRVLRNSSMLPHQTATKPQ